jgi:hypothetical protein
MSSNSARLGEATGGPHADLVELPALDGRLADLPRRDLHVLLAQRVGDVAGGEPARGEPRRVHPEAHRVLALAEDDDVGDAGDALERVADEDVEVVAQEERVVAVVLVVDACAEDESARALRDRDADVPHLRGQPSRRRRHPVLHVDGREVLVAREIEGGRDGADAVVRARGGEIEQSLDAVDRLLDGDGDGRLDGLRAGAGVDRRDRDLRWRELGVLRDRQRRDRDRPREDDHERADGGENGPADEGIYEHVGAPGRAGGSERWTLGSRLGFSLATVGN